MQRPVALFIATTLIAGTTAIYLWEQLQSERRLIGRMKQQAPLVAAR